MCIRDRFRMVPIPTRLRSIKSRTRRMLTISTWEACPRVMPNTLLSPAWNRDSGSKPNPARTKRSMESPMTADPRTTIRTRKDNCRFMGSYIKLPNAASIWALSGL